MNLRRAASVAAALLVLGGLSCAAAALHGHFGKRDIHVQTVQAASGPLKPVELTLDPAMNPLRVTVAAKVDERNRAALANGRENYQLSLYRNARVQKRWMAMLATEDENRKPLREATFSVEPVEVPEAGSYVFVLMRPDGDAAPAFVGHELRVERAGARAGDVTLAWQGAVLLGLGLLLQVFCGVPLKLRAGA